MGIHNPPKLTASEKAANKAAAAARFPDGEGETRIGGQRQPAWITRPDGRKVKGRDLGAEGRASRLRGLIAAAGISQREAARRLHVDPATLRRWLSPPTRASHRACPWAAAELLRRIVEDQAAE
jgi:hypothetical protein